MIVEGLRCIDCAKGMRMMEDDCVDLIVTDPPYVKEEWKKAYTALAKGASRILKPSGYLITYVGHYHLPEVMNILKKRGLIFYWQVCQLNSGSKPLMHHRNILVGYKPILVYQKPPINPTNKIFMDVVTGKQSKEYHPWEQSIHESLHLISRFATPGQLLVDPFTGSGTTILAAKLLGLRYVGFEINKDTFKTAMGRLTQVPLDLSYFEEEP